MMSLRGGRKATCRKLARTETAYLSPGHHVGGGSLADIFRCRRATKWLRLNA